MWFVALFSILQRFSTFFLVHFIINVLRIFFRSVLPEGFRSVDEQAKFPVSYMWCVLRGYAKIDCQIDMNHMKIRVAFTNVICHGYI